MADRKRETLEQLYRRDPRVEPWYGTAHGVDVVLPGREFAFHTERDGQERTPWGYRLTPAGSGTVLVEWWDRVGETPWVARLIERVLLGGRQKHNEANVRASLARIKALAEA